jgi:predicted nucleic acid-binding protein
VPVVVSDTGPLHYLFLIGKIDILPSLFGTVAISDVILTELGRSKTPQPLRDWAAHMPAWLEIRAVPAVSAPALAKLDEGERETIALAALIGAELVLMDDRAGVAVARSEGFGVTGTLGLLDLAAERGLIDLKGAFASLKATNFHVTQTLLDTLLARHAARQG